MNAPFLVSQLFAQTQPVQNPGGPPAVRLARPSDGAATVIRIEPGMRLDFQGIANEQIVLVRAGDRLVILFQDRSSIVLEQFFDGQGRPVDGVGMLVGDGQVIAGPQFATLFPISTDQSILPAAGPAAAAGSNGSAKNTPDPTFDDPLPRNPLDLLGDEAFAAQVEDDVIGPARFGPTFGPNFSDGNLDILVDEDGGLIGGIEGGPNDPAGVDSSESGTFTGALNISFGSSPPAPVNPLVLFFEGSADGTTVGTASGRPVLIFGNGTNSLEGRVADGEVIFRFTVTVNPDGTSSYEFTIFDQMDHRLETSGSFEDNLLYSVRVVATNADGLQGQGTLVLGINDDSPEIGPASVGSGSIFDGIVDEDTGFIFDESFAAKGPSFGWSIGNPGGPGDAPFASRQTSGNLNIRWGADDFDIQDGAGQSSSDGSGSAFVSFDYDGFGPLQDGASFNGNSDSGALTARSVYFTNANVGFSSPDGGTFGEGGLTSRGQTVLFRVINDGTTLQGYVEGNVSEGMSEARFFDGEGSYERVVFEVRLSDDGSGRYLFRLFDVLDHPVTTPPQSDTPETAQLALFDEKPSSNGYEDDIVLTFNFTAKDFDSDRVNGTFQITVDDDTPIIWEGSQSVTVDEEGLKGGLEGGTLPGDVDGENASAVGELGISWGADNANIASDNAYVLGDRAVTFAPGTVAQFEAMGLTSGGTALVYVMNAAGTFLTAYAREEGPEVFTIGLDDWGSGSYTFNLLNPLDHPDTGREDDIVLNFAFVATDSDGDSVNGSFSVTVNDDSPEIPSSNPTVQLDDDALTGGNPGGPNDDADALNVTGVLQHAYGADGAGRVEWSNVGITLNGFYFNITNNNTVFEILQEQGPDNWLVVAKATITDTTTGAYKVEQLAPVWHQGTIPGNEDNRDITIPYRVYDRDGDNVTGFLNINFDDDIPTVSANAVVQLDDDSLPGGNPGGVGDDDTANLTGILAHSFGGDGAGRIEWSNVGISVPFGFWYEIVDGSLMYITQDQGGPNFVRVAEAKLNQLTGEYEIKQLAPVVHAPGEGENNAQVTIAYRVFDKDGDAAETEGQLTINFDDDTPVLIDNGSGSVSLITATVDEDALANANAMGNNDAANGDADTGAAGPDLNEKVATGTLNVSWGADSTDVADVGGVQDTTGRSLTFTNATVGIAGAAGAGLTSNGDAVTFTLEQNGTVLVGRAGSGEGARDVIRISLSDDGTGSFRAELFDNLDHAPGATENDITLTFNFTATDSDGDSVSGQFAVVVDDDLPVVSFGPASGIANGLFFDGFVSNNNVWGQGSGVATGSAAGWQILASTPPGGAANPQLEKVGDGYRGADSPTDSVMVDLEASPGNVQVAQSINGLIEGQTYKLSFEIGRASDAADGSAQLEVVWNGTVVGTYTPNAGLMQTITLDLVAGAGSNAITFREVGTAGDNTGTYLANVRLNDLLVIDETPGVQADSDEPADQAAVAALFGSVTNPGTDSGMGSPQYATSALGALVTPNIKFGADGPAANNAVVYSLAIGNAASGLKTTEGRDIVLFLENGLVVGRYDAAGGAVTGTDPAAFAFRVDPVTGSVSVAQYVSLQHPDATSADEGISLNAGALSVVVTVTDYDLDPVSASADISGLIRFEDDAPTLVSGNFITRTVDEDDIDTTWSRGTSPDDGNADGSLTENAPGPNDPAIVTGTLAGVVNAGADNPVTFSFTADAVSYLQGLQLYSKQTALPENGQLLTYTQTETQTQSGAWQIITASEPPTPGIPNSGNPVFELRINTTTGAYEFRLFDELIHKAPASGADQNFELRSGPDDATIDALNFGAIIKATDGDGDSVVLTNAFKIQIRDDVPEADLDLSLFGSLNHDETPGTQPPNDTTLASVANRFAAVAAAGDDPDVAGTGAIGFARSFLAIAVDDSEVGADAPALVRSFSLVGGGSTSLQTTEGAAITLVQEGSLLVGRVVGGINDGKAAFALAIDADSGEVFLAQYLSLKHPNTNSDDEAVSLSGANVSVRLTVTDSDGDTDTDTVNIGSRISFDDDGPSIRASVTDGSASVLTTQDADTIGAAFDTAVSTANFSGAFAVQSSSFGADGPGAITWSFGLNLTVFSGTNSGLKSDGADIKLYKLGDVIVGATSAPATPTSASVVFSLSVAPSTGVVTLTQFKEIDHGVNQTGSYDNDLRSLANGLVRLTGTATITDGDGDKDTSTVNLDLGGNIRFADDGPSAGTVSIKLDDDSLAGGNPGGIGDDEPNTVAATGTLPGGFGADGPGAFSFLTTGAPANFVYTPNGTGLTITQNGVTVLTLTLDAATGQYTVTQVNPIQHAPGQDENNLSLTIGYKVTDGENGDTALGSITIDIDDDTPVIGAGSGNLVQNPSFETTPVTVAPGTYALFSQINGWTNGKDKAPFEIQAGNIGGLQAQDGVNKVELDSDTDGGVQNTNSTIQQTITTVPGESYVLTFWYAPRPGAPNNSSGMQVDWNGEAVQTINSNQVPQGWQQYTVVLTATGTSSVLSFTALGQPDELGAYLDNVSLVAVTTVDEDGINNPPFAVGNKDSQPGDAIVANTDGDNSEATATGQLNIQWGADQADAADVGGVQDSTGRSLTFTNTSVSVIGVNALTSNGEAIAFSLENNGTVMVGKAGTRDVIRVALSDDGTGSFRVTLLDNIDQAPGQQENDVLLRFNYTATDADGDSVTGSFMVAVDDDVPTAGYLGAAPLTEAADAQGAFIPQQTSGTLNFQPGADGAKVTALVYRFGSPTTTALDPDAPGGFPALTSGGVGVTVASATDANAFGGQGSITLTGTAGAVTVFTLVVNQTTGAYTYTQSAKFDHPDAGVNGSQVGADDALRLVFDFQVTDGDGDQTAAFNEGILQIDIRDDGPAVSLTAAQNLIVNGNFSQGAPGDWTGTASWGTFDLQSGGQAGTIPGWSWSGADTLERVNSDHRGASLAGGGQWIDFDAGPGNITLTQTLTGLVSGASYVLTFDLGKASDTPAGSAHLEVLWNGVVVATITPETGQLRTLSLSLEAAAGDNVLTFRELGTVDFSGAYLANVSLTSAVVIDETAGVQADTDEVLSVPFAVSNPGNDTGLPQYAQANIGAFIQTNAIFGADGPGAGGGLSYALTLANSASGLKTTEGRDIVLFNEGGLIVGRFDAAGGSVESTDPAAIAFRIDPATGLVTVAQYVSLQHPNGQLANEAVVLKAGSISVVVTATDGDGDTATASTDISGAFVFRDDAPVASNVAPITQNLSESALDTSLSTGSVDADVPANGPAVTAAGNLSSLVNFGADGLGSFGLSLANLSPSLQNLTSKGQPIVYAIDGSTLVGYVDNGTPGYQADGDRTVFTFNLAANGDYTFTLLDQLDHGLAQNALDIPGQQIVVPWNDSGSGVGRTFMGRLPDGDVIGRVMNYDDTPVTVELRQTSPSGPVLTFTLAANSAVLVNLGNVPNNTVFQTFINGAAGGTFTTGSQTTSIGTDVIALALGSAVVATDGDGDAVALSSGLVINVADDLPVASADSVGIVPEDAPFTVNVLANDKAGADEDLTVVGASVVQPGAGTVSILTGGNISFDPAPGYAGPVTINYSVRDRDGDVAMSTVSLTVGPDSKPQVGNATTVTVDEDGLANAAADASTPRIDETASTGNATGSGTVTVDFGNDRPADLAGAITLKDDVALDGQLQTLAGQPVTFELVSGVLVGSAGGNEVIRISLTTPSAGAGGTATFGYQVTLLQPVKHAAGGVENAQTLSNIGFEVTDSDGSKASGTFNVSIDDDVPSLTIPQTDPVTVNEGTTFSAGTWTLAGGADGVTSVTIAGDNVSLPLDLSNPANQTSFWLGGGLLTVKADKTWTYTAPTVASDQTVSFTITATDRDGDTSTDTQTVLVKNVNQPLVVSGSIAGTVEEEDLPGGIEDLNGAGDTASLTNLVSGTPSLNFTGLEGGKLFSLVATAGSPVKLVGGANLTSDGQPVVAAVVGNTLYGYVESGNGTGYASGDKLIFTLALTNTTDGSYTFTLNDSIDHHASGDGVEGSVQIDLGGYLRVTDQADTNDTAAITDFKITVIDDVPVAFTPATLVRTNEVGSAIRALDTDTNIDNNVGADQPGKLTFPSSLNGTSSGLTSGGLPIVYSVSGNGQVLTGATTAGTVFTVTLNPDGSFATANDRYTFQQLAQVDGGASSFLFEDNDLYDFQGGNKSWASFSNLTNDDSRDILLTPIVNGLPEGSINSTASSGGVQGANGAGTRIGPTEGIRLDFVTDISNTPSGNEYATVGNRNHDFEGHYGVNGASAKFTGINTDSDIRIKLFNDPDGNDVVGDGARVNVTGVAVSIGSQTLFAQTPSNSGGTINLAFSATLTVVVTFQIVNAILEAVVSDVPTNATIAAFSNVNYNSIEFYHAGGDDFAVGTFGTTTIDSGKPVGLTLPVNLSDSDGDSVAGALNILLTPSTGNNVEDFSGSANGVTDTTNTTYPHTIGSLFGDTLTGDTGVNHLFGLDGNDTLIGGAGADYLHGGAGNDVLFGGAGADRLVGSLGADTFRYTAASEGGDTIVDFNKAEGDIIEILASAFGGVSASGPGGTLDPTRFAVVSSATADAGANARFVLVDANGTGTAGGTTQLYYDSNGGGGTIGADRILLATLENGAELTAAHIKPV